MMKRYPTFAISKDKTLTTISLDLKASGLIGGDYPAKGVIRFEPTRTRITPGTTPAEHIVPRPFTIPMDSSDGIVTFNLAPTEAHWVWKIVLTVTGVNTWTEYVHVPDVATMDYALLDRVDPDTLNLASEGPSPAWWAALSNALKGIKKGEPGQDGKPGAPGQPGQPGQPGKSGVQRDEVATIVADHVEPLLSTTVKTLANAYLGSNPNVVAAAAAAVDANPQIESLKASVFIKPTASNWDFTTPGSYPNWTGEGSPTPERPQTWNVQVLPTPTQGNLLAVAYSHSNPAEIWSRRKAGSVWSPWRRPGDDMVAKALADAKTYADTLVSNIPSPAVSADIGIHQHAMRLSHLRARVGAPRLRGKACVTLIFDHGTNNFESLVLPVLRANGMRATLAVNSQMYSPDYNHVSHENKTNWTKLKSWHDNDGIEIANHGRTHKDATGNSAIKTEIIGGRQELEQNLPGVKIDTFVTIGTTGDGTKWDGFNDGATLESYYETFAGRCIMDGHALATGLVQHQGTPNRVYPLDGMPKYGSSGYWLDAGQEGIDQAKSKIDEAVTHGGGVIIRMHPYLLDWNNQISTTQFTNFISYLKTRVQAGELEVKPYREWSLAVSW